MNYQQLEERLLALGHNEKVAQAMVSAMATLDKYELTGDERYSIYTLFGQVGLESLESLPESILKGDWMDFDLGNVAVGDYVRIKKDAYTSESGVHHNGKVGRLLRMYGGRCTVGYIGLDTGDNMRHPVTNLESLKRV